MANTRWRIVGFDAAADVVLSKLWLLNSAQARVDAGATVTSTVPPVAGTLAAIADTNPATSCTFLQAQVAQGGFAIEITTASAVDAAALGVDATGVRELQLQQWSGSTWVNVALWMTGGRALVSKTITITDFVTEGDPTNMFLTNEPGGVRRNSFTRSSVSRYTQATMRSLVDSVELTITIVSDSLGIRHSGLMLMDRTGDLSGVRVVWQSNATFRASLYTSSSSVSDISPVYDVQPPVLEIGKPAVMRIDRNGDTFTVYVDGVRYLEFVQSIALELHVAFWGYGNITDFTALKMTETSKVLRTLALPAPVVAASAPTPEEGQTLVDAVQVARDTEFGGPGEYPFKVEGLPASQKARVVLLRARDKLVARETWSAADGTGIFTGLPLDAKFIAVAQDPSGAMHPCGAEHFARLPEGA